MEINKYAMKRLLRQKRVSALQIGRIMFLNNCILSENSNNEQLFTVEEMDQLLHNFYQYCSEEEYKEFKLYQHLVTFSLNVLNLLLAKNAAANQSAAFLISQAKAARYLMKDYAVKFENKVNEKEGFKGIITINAEATLNGLSQESFEAITAAAIKQSDLIDIASAKAAYGNIFDALNRIGAYKVFYQGMKHLLHDRRLTEEYELFPSSRELLNNIDKMHAMANKKDQKISYLYEQIHFYPFSLKDCEGMINPKVNPLSVAKYLKEHFNYSVDVGNLQNEVVMQDLIHKDFK